MLESNGTVDSLNNSSCNKKFSYFYKSHAKSTKSMKYAAIFFNVFKIYKSYAFFIHSEKTACKNAKDAMHKKFTPVADAVLNRTVFSF